MWCVSPCRGLSQQPTKLPDYLAFRAHVNSIHQSREDLLVALPGQVQDMYATVTGWGFRLPHTDQVCVHACLRKCVFAVRLCVCVFAGVLE